MSKHQIKHLVVQALHEDGLLDTGIAGVQLFRVSQSVSCAPAVYQPTVVAIVSGAKQAILDGKRYHYDSSQYLCCPMSMPVEAGTPEASPDNPLLGVYITLDPKLMTDLALEMERANTSLRPPQHGMHPEGLTLARWDERFTDALLRLLQLSGNATDSAILGEGRLRELYYAILKGDAGHAARRAFGVGNQIARSIELLSSRLGEVVTIEEMAAQVGMSRAVFHRKFKQATSMSPIQFVKSMRLNNAAMKIAGGTPVNVAAMEVGYVSSSQFSREFKRMYGQSPKQWGLSRQLPGDIAQGLV
ncbi:AraC family transcriptional regulator [Aliagarivorans taiwanensis]|uniref:AraC family transcriptional regulator n=1 Tax=Aliagarivorans taiwanensis TaxID=561966 RepID=UPI000428D915|nr:AraC family transcriptional regulator [Aliagarivorans taiwanensis]